MKKIQDLNSLFVKLEGVTIDLDRPEGLQPLAQVIRTQSSTLIGSIDLRLT